MCGAHGFALAATQAILDRIGNGPDVALLHDERLVTHQPETGGVGVGQVGMQCGLRGRILIIEKVLLRLIRLRKKLCFSEQFTFIEPTLGVNAALVVCKRSQFGIGHELQLGDANAVFA